jgi:O-antigen ligase
VGFGIGSSWFDEQRTVLITVLAAFALSCWLIALPGQLRALAPFLIFVLVGAISAMGAARPYVAFLEWAQFALIWVFVLAVATRLDVSDSVTVVATVVMIVAGAYVAGVLANYASALLVGFPVGTETFLVGFSNPRFPAQLQVLTIPLGTVALAACARGWPRYAVYVVLVLWWMCFFGSGSRTGWVALAAAAALLVLLGPAARSMLRQQVALALLGGILYAAMFVVLPGWLGVQTQLESGRVTYTYSISARWELLGIALNAWIENPVLGLGPMHFAYVNNGLGAHPHNAYVQLLAEWGLPAAVVAVGSVLALWTRMFRRAWAGRSSPSEESDHARLALLASVTALLVGSLADGYWVIPTSQAMAAIVLALAVASVREVPTSPPSTFMRVQHFAATAVVIGAVLVVASLTQHEFGEATQREQAWRAKKTEAFWPRFWQQGWIGPDDDPTAPGSSLQSKE